ncbi:MAG: hypothetical protein HYV38_02170 [Candidatus Levybacteria bacterium]|nr:hypothetical protein [Candidatus Levybacteria bacterium]
MPLIFDTPVKMVITYHSKVASGGIASFHCHSSLLLSDVVNSPSVSRSACD